MNLEQKLLITAYKELRDLYSVLYGQGYNVEGWHLNGALEPIDGIMDSNSYGALDKLEAYIRNYNLEVD